jgi:hypothetical protein
MSYKYICNNNNTLYLVLPGASLNTSTGIMKHIIDRLEIRKEDILAINYPFQDRLENKSSGEKLLEEQHEIILGLDSVSNLDKKWDKIVVIAKSISGAVVSRLLFTLIKKYTDRIDLYILGCLLNDVTLDNITYLNKFVILQGELDPFGSPSQVKEKFNNANVITIPNADHSYRNSEKQPIYEPIVINLLFREM